MQQRETLSHVAWECKYHVVFVPKYRRKVLYGQVRRRTGAILRSLCEQRGVTLIEGHLMPDHVHMCLAIPPKHSVSSVVGFLKGKSAIWIHNETAGRRKGSMDRSFWARGYYVNTVGRDEKAVREYIRRQEEDDRRHDQLRLQ